MALQQLLANLLGSLDGSVSAERSFAAACSALCARLDTVLDYLTGLRRDRRLCAQECGQVLQYLAWLQQPGNMPLLPASLGCKLRDTEAAAYAHNQQQQVLRILATAAGETSQLGGHVAEDAC